MKILIIKFAALGDVLRTTPILRPFRKICPDAHISWLTEEESLEILYHNPFINEIITFASDSFEQLRTKEFDLVINLDKDLAACAVAELVKAAERKGFGLSGKGEPRPLNPESEYAYRLGIDDELKFRINEKSYQEITFEQLGLKYNGEEYILELKPEEADYGKKVLANLGVNEGSLKVGINTGSGTAFAGKKLEVEKYAQIAERVHSDLGAQVLLLGGPREKKRNERIKKLCAAPVIDTGCDNPIRGFASIVSQCDLVLTGDTVALHLAIATQTPVVAIFGSTCHQEIDLYGRGEKIASTLACSPCYKKTCDKYEACMKEISVDQIFEAIARQVKRVASKNKKVLRALRALRI